MVSVFVAKIAETCLIMQFSFEKDLYSGKLLKKARVLTSTVSSSSFKKDC